MQKAGCHETPPLARGNRRPVLRPELEQCLDVGIQNGAASSLHAVETRGEIQAGVDEQDEDCQISGVRNQAAEDLSRVAALHAGRGNGFMAIRADTIIRRDKRPAMRAHAARFHRDSMILRDAGDAYLPGSYWPRRRTQILRYRTGL